MNAQIDLIEGTTRDLSKSQYFTPPELAQRVVEWAGIGTQHTEVKTYNHARGTSHSGWMPRPMRVLEPSAGNGALVRPLVAAGAEVDAVELDDRYRAALCDLLPPPNHRAWCGEDFLEVRPERTGKYDLVVTNPPYEDGQDVEFILHALRFAPSVVGIFRADIMYGVDRCDALWSKVFPTRLMFLKRRWFKDPQTGKGGETNYLVAKLVKRRNPGFIMPSRTIVEWW